MGIFKKNREELIGLNLHEYIFKDSYSSLLAQFKSMCSVSQIPITPTIEIDFFSYIVSIFNIAFALIPTLIPIDIKIINNIQTSFMHSLGIPLSYLNAVGKQMKEYESLLGDLDNLKTNIGRVFSSQVLITTNDIKENARNEFIVSGWASDIFTVTNSHVIGSIIKEVKNL